MISLSYLDISVITLYFLIVLGIGFLTAKKATTGIESFLLAGRRLTLPLFVGTLVSTWYGGIIGVGEISYSSGLYNWLTQGLFWYLSYIIFALFLAVRLRNSNQYTLPDQLEIFYGKGARKIGLFLNFMNCVPVAYVISLGVMIEVLFGLPLSWGIVIGGIFSMSYTFLGGFIADVYTDFLQFVCMFVGMALIVIFSFFQWGGADYLTRHLPPTHLSLTGGLPITEILVWGFIAMTTLVDPNWYQRCYAAKTPRVAKYGILLSVLFWMVFDFFTTSAGLYARAAFPNIEGKHAYFYLAQTVLPPVLKGVFLAGMLATIMSTLDSYFLVAATTISRDLYQKILRPHASEKGIVWMTRAGILITGCFSIILALGFHGSIKYVWKLFGSVTASALLIPLMIGFWYRGQKRKEAGVASMISGLAAASFFYIGDKFFHLSWCGAVEPLYPGMAASFLIFLLFNFKSFSRDGLSHCRKSDAFRH